MKLILTAPVTLSHLASIRIDIQKVHSLTLKETVNAENTLHALSSTYCIDYIWATFALAFRVYVLHFYGKQRHQHGKCEVQAVIHYLYLNRLTSQDVFSDTKQTHSRFAPSDSVSKTERILKRHTFSDDEFTCTANAGWKSRKNFQYNDICTSDKCWTKCISVARDYVANS